jgi:hypothetical protein
VGPIIGLDAVEKRKTLHCLESNPVRPAGSLSLYRLIIELYNNNYISNANRSLSILKYCPDSYVEKLEKMIMSR